MKNIYLVYCRKGGESAEVIKAYTSKIKAEKYAEIMKSPDNKREFNIKNAWVFNC